jgi:hypothetical protein
MGKQDRLWARYWAIRDNQGNGHRMPILWHLAFRRDSTAMIELSSTLPKSDGLPILSVKAVLHIELIALATLWAHSTLP